jgi:hypothetical protein
MVKNTYGTGCFMLMNTGTAPVASTSRLLTTVAWKIGERTDYALEGSVFVGGAVVQWLRDGLGIIASSAEVESLACQVKDTDGVYLVPAFAGLGAPRWDPYARGIVIGISRGTKGAHIARAALESIAYQSADLLECMQVDSGIRIAELRVDGGATANDTLMQFQADILGVPVVRPSVRETTALGAACLAGLAAGWWKSAEEIGMRMPAETRFLPRMDGARVERLTRGWKRALERSLHWVEPWSGDKKRRPASFLEGAPRNGLQIRLYGFYVFRRRAFLTLRDIETDPLTLGQRSETCSLNRTVVNEYIATFILFDESEALLLIEPFHFTFWHRLHPPFLKSFKSDPHIDRK